MSSLETLLKHYTISQGQKVFIQPVVNVQSFVECRSLDLKIENDVQWINKDDLFYSFGTYSFNLSNIAETQSNYLFQPLICWMQHFEIKQSRCCKNVFELRFDCGLKIVETIRTINHRQLNGQYVCNSNCTFECPKTIHTIENRNVRFQIFKKRTPINISEIEDFALKFKFCHQ